MKIFSVRKMIFVGIFVSMLLLPLTVEGVEPTNGTIPPVFWLPLVFNHAAPGGTIPPDGTIPQPPHHFYLPLVLEDAPPSH